MALKYFITLKDDYDKSDQFDKTDISCIEGNKKKIANDLIDLMNSETLKFNELPETTQELIIEIIRFIKENNTDT